MDKLWLLRDGMDRAVVVAPELEDIFYFVDTHFSGPDFKEFEWVMRRDHYPELHVVKNPPYSGSNIDYYYAVQIEIGEKID